MKKKFTRLAGGGIKSTWLILKTEMSMYKSKANLDGQILFCKIAHHLDEKLGKCWLVRVCLGTRIPHSILVHDLLAIKIEIRFLKLTM